MMKSLSVPITLLFAVLTVGCAAHDPSPFADVSVDYVVPSVKVHDDDLSLGGVPKLEKALIDVTPIDRKDGLVLGELGVDGGDKAAIIELAKEIANGQYGKIDSLLIAHENKLIFESYYLRGRINLTHPQASATKTYTGLALGRAIQLGYLTMADLDKPVTRFFNELDSAKLVEGAQRITLHQALTMRTGIRISDEQKKEFEENPDQVQGQNLVRTLLEQSAPISSKNLNEFSYGNYSSSLVMQVIEAVVPGTAENFIRNELHGKLGITTYSWQPGLSGLPAGGWKSSITSRAMYKFGMLIDNKGKWNGEQLISEAFIAKANSRLLYTGDEDIFGGGKDVSNQGYGYFMWSGDLKVGDKSFFSTSTQGGGGQFIIFIDALDLIVVTTGHEREVRTLQMVAEKILPAFSR